MCIHNHIPQDKLQVMPNKAMNMSIAIRMQTHQIFAKLNMHPLLPTNK